MSTESIPRVTAVHEFDALYGRVLDYLHRQGIGFLTEGREFFEGKKKLYIAAGEPYGANFGGLFQWCEEQEPASLSPSRADGSEEREGIG